MICPNCKSIIPDDSKFCPDCGTPVINAEELRSKAKEIVSNYKDGYEFYVKNGTLPCSVYNSTVENCERIIAMKNSFISKQRELDEIKRVEDRKKKEEQRIRDEKQKTEEQRIRNNASEIIRSYPKGYRHYVDRGSLPTLNSYSSISDCRKIISYKESITLKHNKIVEEENEYILKRKANFIKEQCKPDNSTNIVWTIILIIVIYVWSCIEQPYEAFGKNLFAPVFGIFIYPILRVFFNNPETIQKKNIEEWKKAHPNDPVCKYL